MQKKLKANGLRGEHAQVLTIKFQIVLNTVRMHYLETLFSKSFLQLQIVSNIVRVHA